MTVPSNSDPNPEPSKPKSVRLRVILNVVLKVAYSLYALYRGASRLIDFIKKLMD